MTFGIGRRVALGFAAIVLVAAGIGWYEFFTLTRVAATAEQVVREDVAILRLFDSARVRLADTQTQREYAVLVHFLSKIGGTADSEGAMREKWRGTRKAAFNALDILQAAIEKRIAAPGEARFRGQWRNLVEAVAKNRENLQAISQVTEEEFRYFDVNDLSHQIAINNRLDRLRSTATVNFSAADDLADQFGDAAAARLEAVYSDADDVALIGLAALIVVALAVGFPIYRSVVGPLSEFVRFAERIGSGDLTQTTSRIGSDEIGRLGKTLNAMVDGLRGLAQQIRSGAEFDRERGRRDAGLGAAAGSLDHRAIERDSGIRLHARGDRRVGNADIGARA